MEPGRFSLLSLSQPYQVTSYHPTKAVALSFTLELISATDEKKVAYKLEDEGGEQAWGISLPAFLTINQDLVCSGVIGSGLCIFSKHPIQEFTQHVYTLNGYPYMVSLISDFFHLPSPPPAPPPQ